MNPNPNDRKEKMLVNVRAGAKEQSSPTHRENYLKSCEAHGGDMIEVAAAVRAEFPGRYDAQPNLDDFDMSSYLTGENQGR